jgi:hypothetical protein
MATGNDQNHLSRERIRAAGRRVAGIYKTCALVTFNTILFYVLLNLLLWPLFLIRDANRATDPITEKYGADLLDKVYPDFDRNERQAMLAENWNRPYIYEDYTHFRERPIAGKYVNVTEAGYRYSVRQGPWPPVPENLNVFVFGGSTTFGYGLPDAQTVPSFLQEALSKHTNKRVCVYNFGVGWYQSTQERVRFETLLVQGHVPDIAVFIDGLNDRIGLKPAFSQEMARAFEEVRGFQSQVPGKGQQTDLYWRRLLEVCFLRLPVGRLAKSLAPQRDDNQLPKNEDLHARLRRSCDVYLANKRLIEESCKRYGVTPIFVWQPVPGYKYDLKYHVFGEKLGIDSRKVFHSTMRELLDQMPADPQFLWCADIQESLAEPLYVDHHHYTGAFSKIFAEHICRSCLERKLLDKHLKASRK